MELRQLLLQNTSKLLQAAEAVCVDKGFIYDTVYLAVIKTRQKYKKLANKERAVEVCISLMKQPKKHVNQNFSSVEDCIEKAMVAKVVPWKPIISAVAVVLAIVIVLPFCLPKEPPVIDPKGFVMEGTQAFANRVEGSDVQLKNFHKISDLGAADIRELANTELNANGTDVGDAQYRIHTTSNGITFLVQVYVNADTKKSEFILYKGETDGWHEVLGKQKLADLRSYTSSPVIASNIWINYSYAVLDEDTQTIAFLCDSNIPFLSSGGNSTNNPEICVTTYDLKKQAFNDLSILKISVVDIPWDSILIVPADFTYSCLTKPARPSNSEQINLTTEESIFIT